MGLADWKDDFDKATPRNSSDYMEPGNFLLRIDVIKEGTNRSKIDNFKVEGTIIHKLSEEGSQSVGQSVTHMMSAKSEYYMNDLKLLVAGMFGISVNDATFDQVLQIAADSQPLKGAVVEYYCSRKEGKVYTNCQCRGLQPEATVREKLSDAEWERFGDSLKFSTAN